MTLCIGIEHGRHVFLGADSASVADDSLDVVRDPKVFLRNGWAIAHAGYWRLGDLLQYRLRVNDRPHGSTADRPNGSSHWFQRAWRRWACLGGCGRSAKRVHSLERLIHHVEASG
jgi:hypothetical protein